MRLRRLDLTRFGRFTDHAIDFGECPAGTPDLHVIYGPNEAGKSTALAAFLDLLFGIGTQSRFNFLHPYPTMRIGAALELAGGVQEVVRIKRPQNSLLDAADRPLSDGLLVGTLGGIDRESYRTMFSLDDETLEAGGESILASKGDLGQLLFSASAGLADLSHRLVALRAEAEGFYKYRSHNNELSRLKATLAALKSERERTDTLASHYAQLVETRERASAQYEEAIRRRGEISSRMDEIQRLLNALPRLGALRDLRARLAPLADLPEGPPGWVEDLPRLQREEVELATRAQGIAGEIARLSAEIGDSSSTTGPRASRIGSNGSRIFARHITAEKDIPERRLQGREVALTISGILGRIERQGEPDPARLVLGASAVGALRGLIETRSGIETAMSAAAGELAEAQNHLDDAQTRLAEAGPAREARHAALVASLAALRADDSATRRRIAARARATHLDTLAEKIRALRPWSGEVEALADMTVPDAGLIERWAASLSEAQRKLDRHEPEAERLAAERRRLEAELDAIGSVAGVVSDHEASTVRMAREQAWAEHRRALDGASADAFEAVLRHDDVVTGARLGHAADLARLHQAKQALALLDVDLGRAETQRDAGRAALQAVQGEIGEAIRVMAPALPGDMALPQIQAWLKRRDLTIEARASVQVAERDLREADADATAARGRLTALLAASGLEHDPDAAFDLLMASAQAAIDREAARRALRDAVEDRRRALKIRERDAQKAAAADQAWTAAWAKACAASWLGEDGAVPQVATVREIIAAVAELRPALDKQEGFADRIVKMEKDQAAFASEVSAIAHVLGLDPAAGSVLDLAQAVDAAVRAAETARGRRETAQRALADRQQTQRALAETQAIHAARKAEMTGVFGVCSLAEVGAKLQSVERKADLDRQAEAATRDILDALRLPSLEAAEAALDAADRPALDAEHAELKARFDDQDSRSRDLFSQHAKAADEVAAVGGDGAVARIEEQRRTILVDIEERAGRYLRLRVGTVAAEQALRAYRDQHRSSMMERASKAFETISRGAYSGLATQPEKDSEILVALPAGGGSKVASELSKGTRFQLYLALRVAGYHEFAEARPAPPFIADDIMETFDDNRAEEAFRLFADMARVGQVIYLTHHQHLCDIVRRACPAAKIHALAARAPNRA